MSDDELRNSFISGFQDRAIFRDETVQNAEKAVAQERAPYVQQVQDAYPEVDVKRMELHGVQGAVVNAGRYLFNAPAMAEKHANEMGTGIRAVASGVVEGWNETMEVVQMAGYALSGQKQFLQRPPTLQEVSDEAPNIPSIPTGDGTKEQVIKSIGQFLSLGGPVGGAAKKAGASALKASMAGGAAGDALAFDPKEGNLSTLMNELDMGNDFTEWMDSSEDGEFEGRLKNAVEGAGIGLAFDGVIKAAKAMKAKNAGATGAGSVAASTEADE